MTIYTGAIELEDDVPVPKAVSKYPYKTMAIGQSFFAPQVTSVNQDYWTRLTGHKYVSRIDVKDGVKGIRCWRVS